MDAALKDFLIGLVNKYGVLGLFLSMLISYGSVFLPSFGPLILVAAVRLFHPIQTILVGGFGAAIGESVAYVIAREGRLILNKEQKKKLDQYRKAINSWGALLIFILASIPFFPFDYIGIAAGLLAFDFTKYTIAVLLGRWVYVSIILFLSNSLIW